MFRLRFLAVVILVALPAGADEQILPVFALRVPGEAGSLWTSELLVTNPGANQVTVHQRTFMGETSGGLPCLPLVQPFLVIEPHSTRVWSANDLALGIGCPESAAGALTFFSEGDVTIGSRMVNTLGDDTPQALLSGYGQEIDATPLATLPTGALLLPGAAWHANACGPKTFDTNVFFANPGVTPVRVSLRLQPDAGQLLVDGVVFDGPYEFTVQPHEFRRLRVGAADNLLAVCLPPAVGAIALDSDGGLAILGSVVDRATGDARTLVPIERKP